MYTQTKWYREGKEEGEKLGALKAAKKNLTAYISYKTGLPTSAVGKELSQELDSITEENDQDIFNKAISIEHPTIEDFKQVFRDV